MKTRELYDFRRKMYDEIIKIEDVKEALKFNNQVYIYNIMEGTNHIIKVFTMPSQLNSNFLKENGFTDNAFIERIYTVNRKVKQCF